MTDEQQKEAISDADVGVLGQAQERQTEAQDALDEAFLALQQTDEWKAHEEAKVAKEKADRIFNLRVALLVETYDIDREKDVLQPDGTILRDAAPEELRQQRRKQAAAQRASRQGRQGR